MKDISDAPFYERAWFALAIVLFIFYLSFQVIPVSNLNDAVFALKWRMVIGILVGALLPGFNIAANFLAASLYEKPLARGFQAYSLGLTRLFADLLGSFWVQLLVLGVVFLILFVTSASNLFSEVILSIFTYWLGLGIGLLFFLGAQYFQVFFLSDNPFKSLLKEVPRLSEQQLKERLNIIRLQPIKLDFDLLRMMQLDLQNIYSEKLTAHMKAKRKLLDEYIEYAKAKQEADLRGK